MNYQVDIEQLAKYCLEKNVDFNLQQDVFTVSDQILDELI